MTKNELKILENAMAQVQDAIALLDEAQETLVHADPKFEFPVGIIFAAQTSLRIVVELARDAKDDAGEKKPGKKAGKKAAKKVAKKKA